MDLEFATALVTFTDQQTDKRLVIGAGWWVGEHEEAMNVRLGSENHIIIVCFQKGFTPIALSNTVRTFTDFAIRYNDVIFKETELSGDAYQVEVCLKHRGGGSGGQFKQFHSFPVYPRDLLKQLCWGEKETSKGA